MGKSLTKIWIHAVWATKGKLPVLDESWRKKLWEEFRGIAKKHQFTLDSVNGTTDHVHVLFQLHPSENVANIIKLLKGNSSKWINEQEYMQDEERFRW